MAEASTEVNQVHSISFEPMDVHLCSIFLSIMQQIFSSTTATEKILWEVKKMFKIHWEILPNMYKQIKETKTMIITRDEKMQKRREMETLLTGCSMRLHPPLLPLLSHLGPGKEIHI